MQRVCGGTWNPRDYFRLSPALRSTTFEFHQFLQECNHRLNVHVQFIQMTGNRYNDKLQKANKGLDAL